ncbi:MAG: hypothetical protein ACOWW1_01655 [archaeon]|nr:hypothetical protein [Candidatus Bathyarchaeum sp.]
MQTFLFATQGVGAMFVVIFLAAYFGGLPSTETLNSEPSFILAQTVVGSLFIVFLIVAFILVLVPKSKNKVGYAQKNKVISMTKTSFIFYQIMKLEEEQFPL